MKVEIQASFFVIPAPTFCPDLSCWRLKNPLNSKGCTKPRFFSYLCTKSGSKIPFSITADGGLKKA